jgi:hypothetical protein
MLDEERRSSFHPVPQEPFLIHCIHSFIHSLSCYMNWVGMKAGCNILDLGNWYCDTSATPSNRGSARILHIRFLKTRNKVINLIHHLLIQVIPQCACWVAQPDKVELHWVWRFIVVTTFIERWKRKRERESFNTYSYPELSQSSYYTPHKICFHKWSEKLPFLSCKMDMYKYYNYDKGWKWKPRCVFGMCWQVDMPQQLRHAFTTSCKFLHNNSVFLKASSHTHPPHDALSTKIWLLKKSMKAKKFKHHSIFLAIYWNLNVESSSFFNYSISNLWPTKTQ